MRDIAGRFLARQGADTLRPACRNSGKTPEGGVESLLILVCRA